MRHRRLPRAACPVSMCVGRGVPPLAWFVFQILLRACCMSKSRLNWGEGVWKGKGGGSNVKGFLTTVAGNGNSAFVAGRVRVMELLAAPTLQQQQSQMWKTSHHLLQSFCVAIARTGFVALTFGLAVNESTNSLNDAAAGGANYTSLQQGTVWSRTNWYQFPLVVHDSLWAERVRVACTHFSLL